MSTSSSNKKIKKMSVDRLSALPDSILRYILSFLEMKQAAITCLLSKRWQFLWTELPALRFWEGYSRTMEKKRKFVIRVHKTLVICSRQNLERFEVNFTHSYDECFASDFNVWIRFAVENKVKIFSLLLPGLHMLPQMMYSRACWTSLTLHGCIMAPRGTIQWQSLTTLRIRNVELNEHTFPKIFSGCPVLISLDIVSCRGFNCLEVSSLNLHRLVIKSCFGFNSLKVRAPSLDMLTIEYCGYKVDLEISTSSIHTFKVNGHNKLCLENIKSFSRAEAEINFDDCESVATDLWNKSIKQFFASIRHFKMLELGTGYIQFLSLIAPNCQLPQSTRGYLKVQECGGNKSIPGILGLLESSPNLETLVIKCSVSYPQDGVPVSPTPNYDLNCDLFHLMTVYFESYIDPNHDAVEAMLTLARILLKKAIVLEKMVVKFHGFTFSSAAAAFYKTSQELLSYPRFSQKAVVLLS